MYKTRNKPHRGIFSLSLILSSRRDEKPRDTFARVRVSSFARLSSFCVASIPNVESSQFYFERLALTIYRTIFDSQDSSFRDASLESRISSGKARRALSSGVKAYNFQPFSFDVRRNEITRSFRISKIVIDTKNRALKHLAFILFPLLDGRPYTWQSIDSFPFRDTYFPSRARFSAFHRGENSVRTNERLAAVKRQTRRFKGWMHLTLKEPHSAPLSCVIFQPVQAYSSSPPIQPEMQYGRRGENNAQLAALLSFSQKSLCVCAPRYTNVFPRAYARSVRTIARPI